MVKYWLVVHNLESFNRRPDRVGHPIQKKINKLVKNDKIIYHAKSYGLLGAFNVTSSMYRMSQNDTWPLDYVYAISPILKSFPDKYCTISGLRKETGLDLSKRIHQGATLVPLSSKEYNTIIRYLRNSAPTTDWFKGRGVDEPLSSSKLNVDIMTNEPTNEMGVVVLFTRFMKDLDFERFDFIRGGFPDACAYKRVGNKVVRKYIEFEFRSSSFALHLDNPKDRLKRCDYIVCWEDDLEHAPVEGIIELKSQITRLQSGEKKPERDPRGLPSSRNKSRPL